MRQKTELERKAQDQELELDEQAGTIQQLEQVNSSFYKFSHKFSLFLKLRFYSLNLISTLLYMAETFYFNWKLNIRWYRDEEVCILNGILVIK